MASSTFSLVHQNIQSLRSNFDMFSLYLVSLATQPDLIFVSEIWIYSNEVSDYNLPNYNFKACCNDSYRSGGVGVFINQEFNSFTVKNLNWPSADVLVLDMRLGKVDWTIIGIYRFCGKDTSAFCTDLEGLLRSINKSRVVIVGDININLLDSIESFNYQTMLASYGFSSLVNEPTRILACLDHVFVKTPNVFDLRVENLPISFSDHNLINLSILSSATKPVPSLSAKKVVRVDYNQLKLSLQSEFWGSVYSSKDCNTAFNSFTKVLKSHIESSKCTTVCNFRKELKPWMNQNLLHKISKLKKFSKKLKHHPNNVKLQTYVKKLSKNIKENVKAVKNLYYRMKFESAGKNSKQTWKVVDDVLGRASVKGKITQIYKYQSNTLITNSQAISNEFNKFFIDAPAVIASHFGNNNSNAHEMNNYVIGASRNYPGSCFFDPINSLEILSVIAKLKNKHSSGFDGVDNVIIKECSWYLVDVLKYLFSLSLDSGIFPDVFKLAVVVPIFKKGDKLALNNYRPISLLSSFSKLFEKLIKRRLLSYLDKIKFLHDNQFGFVAGKSTEEALLHFLCNIYTTINNSQLPTALFVDIAKAFDTVDHSILLVKLASVGVRGNIYNWFKSYLQNRRQVVKVDDSYSILGFLTCGVPQGSVLGPLLFLIYLNSIFELNLKGHATAFADDLALSYAPNKCVSDVHSFLESDLSSLSKWFYYHKLVVSDKSRLMRFGRPNSIGNPNRMMYHVYSCNTGSCLSQCFELEAVNEFKYLGLTIDSELSWNSHLYNIRKNVVTAVHKFYNLRNFCPQSTLRQLYHALVESSLMYGVTSWGGIYFSQIKDLYIAQKRIVKLIYRCPSSTPTVPLFRALNLLPLRYLYIYRVLKLFFVRSNSFHCRVTPAYRIRNPSMFARLPCHSEKFRRFYLFMAPFWFHKLPRHLKCLTVERKHLFESESRTWLLNIDNVEQHF